MKSLWSLLFIVFLCAESGIHAQTENLSSRDRLLTLLRGTWEYHTYDDRWKLEFRSDRYLVMNDTTVKYSLALGAIRIARDNEEIEYPFALHNDSLILEYPDGNAIVYLHRKPGTEEMTVDGKFYAVIDSLHRNLIKFEDALSFSLDSRSGDTASPMRSGSLDGIYRVQGNYIYLCSDNGAIDTAEIRYDLNGDADGIVYHQRLYDKELQYFSYPYPYPTPIPIPYPDPLPPPPPPPPTTIPDNTPVQKPTNEGKRNDGSIRDDKSKDERTDRDKPPVRSSF